MPTYSSILKTMGFLYLETKKAASLLLQGLTADGIKKKSLQENIFLMKTDIRKQEVASYIMNRLKTLDDFLLRKLTNGSLSTSKIIVFLSIMKTDRLLYEFMSEVFAEKIMLMDYTITARDFDSFFQRKSEQSEKVASWSDYTYGNLTRTYKNILINAGLAKEDSADKKKLHITKPVLEQEIIDHTKTTGDYEYIKALIGGK